MQINNLNYSIYNISHKGFVKDYKALKRNVYVLQTKNEFCQKPQFVTSLMAAENAFKDFCRNNPLRATLYGFFKKINLIPQNISRPVNNDVMQKIFIKEKEIMYKIQNLKYIVDGKEYSSREFNNLYNNETDYVKKAEMLTQHASLLNSFEKVLKELVVVRNDYAKSLGYKNYFEYALNLQYGISLKEFDKMLNDYANSDEVKSAVKKRREILEKELGIPFSEMLSSQICPITNFCNIDKYIGSTESIVDTVKNAYQRMGFDLKTLEKNGQINYDLKPYEGKASGAFCRNYADVDSVFIYANLQPDTNSIRAFSHEMGHAMYDLHVSKYLPKSLKFPKAFYNEAVAMMFEKLLLEKGVLENLVPKDILEKYQEYSKIENTYEGLVILAEADFEKEMYNNPNQDFYALRKEINKKYNLIPKNEKWFVEHYAIYPVRRPVYLKGFILAEKMYNALSEFLGTELNSNPKVAEIMQKNIFRYGALLNDRILNRNLKNLG